VLYHQFSYHYPISLQFRSLNFKLGQSIYQPVIFVTLSYLQAV